MDNIMQFLKETWMNMSETFKVLPWESTDDGYTFTTPDGLNYAVFVDPTQWKNIKAYEVSFGIVQADGSIDTQITLNKTDATDIVVTVLDIIFNTIESNDKFYLLFNPTKDDPGQKGIDTKRASLYSRLTKRTAEKYGYEYISGDRIDKNTMGFLLTPNT